MRALCLSLLVFATAAAAQDGPIIGNIEGAEFRPLPIAVAKIRSAEPDAKLAAKVARIIRNDLKLSGVFAVLDPKSFIDTDGLTPATVRYADWQNVGADALVKAQLRGGKLELHAYDVARQRQGLTQVFDIDANKLRRSAHEVADAIYRYYTGEPGIFRTQFTAVRKVHGEKHIYVFDVDGENARRVTRGGGLNLLPSWAPGGKKILFTSYRYDNPDLFEIGVGGSELKRLSNRPGLNTGGRVSPDGSRIALTLSRDGNSEIYLLDRRGNMLKRLTKTWGIDTSPAWSPDGRQIAFVSSRSKYPHIYLMNADGSGQHKVTFTPKKAYNQTPVFSPRGDVIAFTGRDRFNRFDIFLLDLATGDISRVTQNQGNNEDPTFSPNGRLIAFTSTRKGGKQIWVSTLDGAHQQQITFGAQHSNPSWGPFVKTK